MIGRHGLCFWIVLALCACGSEDLTPPIHAGVGGSGTGAAGSTTSTGDGGGGGAPTTCGDGAVDPGEACDTAGESATCNADCTAPACGDGVRNAAAGESCDDGNTADGDFCTAACVPAEVLLEGPFQSNSAPGGMISVASTGGRFVASWSKDEVGPAPEPLQYAAWEANGATAIAEQTLESDAAGGPLAVNAAGRLLDLYWSGTAFAAHYRYASTGGELDGAAQVLAPSYVSGQLGATGSGNFCLFGYDGQIRCTGAGDAFGAPITLVPIGPDSYPVSSIELVPLGTGLLAVYVVKAQSSLDVDELRMRKLDASGQPLAPEVAIAPLQDNTLLAGNVVRKDGSFAIAVSSYDEVALVQFTADGELDGTSASTLAQGVVGGRIAGHSSGRFALVYREIDSQLDPWLGTVIETCRVLARVFSDDAQPIGDAFPIYDAPYATCAWPASVAVNEAGDLFAAWAQFQDGASATSTCQITAKILPGVLAP